MVCDVFKLPLLPIYYVRAKINTPSISNGEFYHTTKECFHFIPIHEKKSHLYTQQLPCYPFFLYCIYPCTPFCAESSRFSSQKAIKENREGWKQPVCKQGDTGDTHWLPPVPHLLSPCMKNNISVDRDEGEWATWNLMSFNEQLSSSQQLPIELAAVSP